MDNTDPYADRGLFDSGPCVSSRTSKTVLLVDDDARLLRSLQRSFADEDYQLLTAVSAAEAKAVLSRHAVDLIMSDNLMPGVLGTEFLADVRSKYPEIVLMILSGYIPPAAADRATNEIGVFRVLTKPCQASKVAAAIREALTTSEEDNVMDESDRSSQEPD